MLTDVKTIVIPAPIVIHTAPGKKDGEKAISFQRGEVSRVSADRSAPFCLISVRARLVDTLIPAGSYAVARFDNGRPEDRPYIGDRSIVLHVDAGRVARIICYGPIDGRNVPPTLAMARAAAGTYFSFVIG